MKGKFNILSTLLTFSVQEIKVIRRMLVTSVLSDSTQDYLHHPRGNYMINDQSWLMSGNK